MTNFLILRKYSPKNMLKGEDFLEKETNSIHNALFLPVTIVSSFVYYAAHTNIENKILVYIAAIFGIIYYILTRLIFTYRLQKHLAETIANYQFKWNLWFVDTTSVDRKTTSIAQTRRTHAPKTPKNTAYLPTT